MPRHRSWLSLITSCFLMSVAAALAFAIIVAGGSAALAGRQSPASDDINAPAAAAETPQAGPGFQGMVTDSRCGARHRRNSGMNPAECARLCVRQGASYVLVDGEHRYKLHGGEESLSKFAGQRIKVSGTRQGSEIQVTSAESLF